MTEETVSVPSADPSAAPRRERGLRTRAGNAMARTRGAVLEAAARAVEKHGARRTTMSDIASLAGVAKGTLYNHFRTKDAVFAAAIDTGIRGLAEECAVAAADDLGDALALAAERLGSHPALRRLAVDEPAVVAALTTIGPGPAWDTARAGVRDTLTAAGRDRSEPTVELVLRWLTSFVASAGHSADAQARLLADAVPLPPQQPDPDGSAPPTAYDDGSVQLSL